MSSEAEIGSQIAEDFPNDEALEAAQHVLLRAHLIWILGNLAACRWLNAWCRMSCGNCSSEWCPRRPRAPRAAGGADTVIAKCWPRPSSWPTPAVPGPSSRRCSAFRAHRAPALCRVDPGPGLGQTPPLGPGRARLPG